jgi:16S rRNA (adenine1518-N6/adenine1519-N6)-dimethyltransferase
MDARVGNYLRPLNTPPPTFGPSALYLVAKTPPCRGLDGVPLGESRFADLKRVTATAFGQRRKMLRASLRTLGDSDAVIAATGVTPTACAEELTVEEGGWWHTMT